MDKATMRKMMGIIGCMVIIFLVAMALLQPVVAADALYRMLHGEQDVIILGEIDSHVGDLLEIRVIRVLQGKVAANTINVKDDFTYYGFTEENGKPSPGDYVVLSLNEKGNHYEQAWYMVRSDHGHMRSLTLYYEPAAGRAPPDLKALQYFVNTGGKATDYYFDGDQVFAQRNLLDDVDLTDSLTAWVGEAEAAEMAAQTAEEEDDEGLTLGVILSAAMIAFFTLVIFIRIRAVFLTQRQQRRQQQRQQ